MKFAFVLVLALFVSGAVQAQEATFGEWVVVRSDNGDMVATTFQNGTSLMLGYRCYKKLERCIYILIADIDCKDTKMYPVLVNSDYSSLSMNAMCNVNPSSGKSELLLSEFDAMNKIMEKATAVGLAIPLADGLFKVVRFKLDGADQAIKYATMHVDQSATYK